MTLEPVSGPRRRAEPPTKPPRRKISVVGVLGELLITAGVFVLLFLGWQLGLNNWISGSAQNAQAAKVSQTWAKDATTAPAPTNRPDPGPPTIGTAPDNAVQFANLIIPRFGPTWEKPIAEGIGVYDVLANGIGHYPGTQMPGDVGNVALAAHRTGWGEPFKDIVHLEIGDSVYIEMEAGWYRYVVRSYEYVDPTGVGVLDPVPQVPGASPTDRLITLTSCNPETTAAERIVVYGVYDTWYPRAGGPPPEIAALVQTAAAG